MNTDTLVDNQRNQRNLRANYSCHADDADNADYLDENQRDNSFVVEKRQGCMPIRVNPLNLWENPNAHP